MFQVIPFIKVLNNLMNLIGNQQVIASWMGLDYRNGQSFPAKGGWFQF
jgi:hypothetical protein